MSDSEDSNDGIQYHLEVGSADLVDTVLFLGSPKRVDKVMALRDDYEERAPHRKYRTVMGSYGGMPTLVISTGIGSPPAAIAAEGPARADADTLTRVDPYGAIQLKTDVGDLVITSDVARQEGTFREYIREDYPVVADHEVVLVLVVAAERLGYDYHAGPTMSADSFYAGQGRSGFEGLRAAGSDSLVEELREANVKNIEMEAAALLTIVSVYGLRAGAVCPVYASRVTGESRTEGESHAAETVSFTARPLAKMDEVKREVGVDRWHAGLSLD